MIQIHHKPDWNWIIQQKFENFWTEKSAKQKSVKLHVQPLSSDHYEIITPTNHHPVPGENRRR